MFVTLEEAKGYLRVDSSDEDELILRLMETSDRLILDVTRQPPEELKEYESVVRTAELYVIAYLYEHREEADHKTMTGNTEVSVFWNQEGDILMIELMRERIMIQKSSTKKDGTGNHALVWSDYYKCYSYVNNLSGKEYWEANRSMRKRNLILSSVTAVRCPLLIRSISASSSVGIFIILRLLTTCSIRIRQ